MNQCVLVVSLCSVAVCCIVCPQQQTTQQRCCQCWNSWKLGSASKRRPTASSVFYQTCTLFWYCTNSPSNKQNQSPVLLSPGTITTQLRSKPWFFSGHRLNQETTSNSRPSITSFSILNSWIWIETKLHNTIKQ